MYGWAQSFNAAFEANTFTGCSPLLVTFTDTSNASGITSRTWIFGNGNTSSGNNATVSATYTAPGLYDVTLVISDGFISDSVTYSQYIEVYNNPSSNFSISNPNQGCAPLSINFTNLTTTSGVPINQYSWDFGDGSQSDTTTNPSHIYLYSGTYQVQLVASDTNGCSSSFIHNTNIQVDPQPVASFSADTVSACNPPLSVTFSNNSTGTPPLSYYWDYSLGTSNNVTPPTTTYPNAGGYDVLLRVTDGNGCSDTLSIDDYIAIGNVIADFQIPDTICPGDSILINNTSFGGNLFNWNFGNGNTSTIEHPTISYSAPGTYTISLTSYVSAGCSDSITKTIVVEDFQISASINHDYSCEVPFEVTYTGTSTVPVTQWNWLLNGYDTVISSSSSLNATYNVPGIWDLTVYATSSNGCEASYTQNQILSIFGLNDTNLIAEPVSGCAPLVVDFYDLSQPFDSIASYLWEFHDGTSSNQQSTQFTYLDTGVYNVTATITLDGGCEIEEIFEIEVGNHQQPNFLVDTNILCSSDTFRFTNLSTDQYYIDSYEWTFVGANSTNTDYSFEPEVRILDTGWVQVMLATNHNGCIDTMLIDSMIYVNGPAAQFFSSMNCDSLFWRELTNSSYDYTSFVWDFGDGSPVDSTNDIVLHDYVQRGNYDVKLIVYNSNTGCVDSVRTPISIREPIACFSLSDYTPCRYQDVSFDANCSQDVVHYSWFDGENDSTAGYADNWDATYVSDTVFAPYLIVKDGNNCADTAYSSLKVFKPKAKFTADTNRGCSPESIQFYDLTEYDTTANSWLWDYQGSSYATTQNPVFSYQNLGYKYYDVQLIATDVLGCKDTIQALDTILIGGPSPVFTISDVTLCVGDQLSTNAVTGGYSQYIWDFGNGDTSYTQNPNYSFPTYGVFDVTLYVVDTMGCDTAFTYPISVDVQGISGVGIVANPSDTNCYPANIQVQDTSGLTFINTWQWDFGDGTSLTTGAPVAYHTYTTSGLFPVKLTVTTSNGCIDSIETPDLINITGPYAEIKILDNVLCLGDTLTFYADRASNVDQFTFDFGDGIIIQQSDSVIQHVYNQTGFVNAYLLMSGPNNTCLKSDSITFFVGHVETELFASDTSGCAPLEVNFTEQSLGETDYMWEIQNSIVSNNNGFTELFNQAGNYQVILTSTNDSTLCSDSDTALIVVNPLPNIEVNDDQVLCIGDQYQLLASGGIEYYWTPNLFLSDTNISNPTTSTTTPITYTVIGVDSNGCVNSDSVRIDIQMEPELNYISPDTVAFPGMTLPIYTDSDMDINYSWSPSDGLSCINCPNPIATPEVSTTYTLTYSDQLGCFMFDTTITIVIDDDYSIYVPNAFTPDGDGINDIFKVESYGFKEFKSFAIFNRWGELLYETQDLNKGWDGTYPNGDKAQSEQVYVYRFTAKRFNGEEVEKIGSVLLLRN